MPLRRTPPDERHPPVLCEMRPAYAGGRRLLPICRTQIPLPVGVAPNATHVDSAATMAPGSPDAVYTIDPTSVMTSAGAKRKLGESQFQAGDQVGPRYTIIKLLGTGGMGAVYQAFDHELGVARRDQGDPSGARRRTRPRHAISSSASSASSCWRARSPTSTSSASTTSATSTASST